MSDKGSEVMNQCPICGAGLPDRAVFLSSLRQAGSLQSMPRHFGAKSSSIRELWNARGRWFNEHR